MGNEWYIIFNGQQVGPVDKMKLPNYGLTPDSQVWRPGMAGWQPASSVPELMDLLVAPKYGAPAQNSYSGADQNYGTPPPMDAYSPNPYNNGGYSSGKSKVAAGVLAILLGGLGIQYFYCGKVGAGFLTILLTCVTCGLWEIVTFIQGIMILTMTDQEFDQKYVYTDKMFPLF